MLRSLQAHLAGAEADGFHPAAIDPTRALGASGDDVVQALLLLLVVCAVVGGLWWRLATLPKPKKPFDIAKELLLARVTSVFIIFAVAGASWDLWWHRAIGRDQFWESPHLMLYAGVFVALILSLYAWYGTRSKRWAAVATTLLAIPIAAPFDALWHILFGVEDFSSPTALIWSPPHMIVVVSSIVAQAFLLPVFAQDEDDERRRFFGTLIFGVITATSMWVVLPLHPTEGFGQLIGFYGASSLAFCLIFVPLLGERWLKGAFAPCSRMVLVAVLMLLVAYGKETNPQIIMTPHDRVPNWLLLFTNIGTALWLDVSARRFSPAVRGAVGGFIASLLLFGYGRHFMSAEHIYPLSDAIIAHASAFVGGMTGALLASRIIDRKPGFLS